MSAMALSLLPLLSLTFVVSATTPTPSSPTKVLFTIPRELSTGSGTRFCIDVRDAPSAGLDFFVRLQEHQRRDEIFPNPWIRPRPRFRPFEGRAPPPPTEMTTTTTTTTSTPPPMFAEKKLVIKTNGRTCDILEIPREIDARELAVRVRGVAVDGSGYKFDRRRRVTIKKSTTKVTFIETDKPVYKPGDLVRVRLLTVNAELKPILHDVKIMWIENPAGVRMEQWTNVSREMGFASAEMRLSKEPVKGTWKVKAKVKGKKVTQSFQVKEYVPPKYSINIETPDFLLLNDEEIKGQVCARYTYGKRVRGQVKIDIQRKRYSRIEGEPLRAEGPLGDDGCFKFNVSIDLKNMRSEWGTKFHFSAEVTEKDTNVKIAGEAPAIGVTRNPIKLEIVEMKSGYKPYIPGQILQIKAKTDSDAPAPDEVINLKISHKEELLNVNLTTDSLGIATLLLKSDLTSQSKLNILAEALTYRGKFISSEENSGTIRYGQMSRTRLFILPVSRNLIMRSWFSPSDSFVKIGEIVGPLSCGEKIDIPIHFTMKKDTEDSLPAEMNYAVVARGKIVDQGTFTVGSKAVAILDTNEAANATAYATPLSLAIDHSFAPAFKLLVYYVRGDGEVVADESPMKTPECLVNDVTIRFDAARRLPGEETKMTLKAAPKSLCGFTVADKSVALMGTGNMIKKEQVFKFLTKGEIGFKHFSSENQKYCERIEEEKREAENAKNEEDGELTPRMIRPWGWGGWQSKRHDSITAFREAGMLVMTDMTLETRPCEKEPYTIHRRVMMLGVGRSMDYDVEAVAEEEMAVMPVAMAAPRGPPGARTAYTSPRNSNNNNNNSNKRKNKVTKKKEKIQEAEIRSFFPETWLFNMHTIDESGETVISKKVPHTITEWQARAVCSNVDVGLGVSPTESLVVFQPFFASASLPYSVIRNEKIPLKIQVFNYLEECLAIKLKLIKYNSIMKAVGPTEKTMCLCAQNSKTTSFTVIPGTLGHINVTVSAEALKDGADICEPGAIMAEEAKGVRDVLIKKLLVEPEGIEMESNYGRFICLDPNGSPSELSFQDQIRLKFDSENYVKKSAFMRVSAIGDVLGPALEGLDDLLRLPTGCGEQNMLKFAPNIFIMEYLQATNQDSKEIKSQALGFMKTGYQRELTYRHYDGSYSAFGNNDDSGSLWLTAFVVKCFGQARKFISIDQKDLDVSIAWLKKNQEPSGKFPTIGRVIHKEMKGGLAQKGFDIGLTAYTIGALIEGGLSPADDHIQRGLGFILPDNATILETLDSYSLLLIANTLTLIDVEHPRLAGIVDMLESRKRGESGIRYWSDSPVGAAVSSSDVEMTAYALLTYTKLGKIDESVEMTRWLTQQRNGKGGFLSTQDTVMGLQALAKISETLYAKTGNFRVKFETEGETEEFYLNQGNRLLLHRAEMEFSEDPAKRALNVRVTPETAGCAMIQANLKYNVIKPPSDQKDNGKKSFNVKHSVMIVRDKEDHCKWRRLETCVKYQGPKNSGMVMAEVKMVSGWIPDKDSLKKITKGSKQLKRFDVDSRNIKFYLDNLKPDSPFCFAYLVEQQITVGDAKPGLVKVYDYYEPEVVVDQKYKIHQTCGTKEEIPFNMPPEVEGMEGPFQRRSDANAPREVIETMIRNMDEEKDEEEEEDAECPDCDVKNFGASFCNASLVVSATVLENQKLRLYQVHKGATTIKDDVAYDIDDDDEVCRCAPLAVNRHVLLMFSDADLILDGSVPIDLDEDVAVIPLESGSDIDSAIPRTLLTRSTEDCAASS